MERVWGDRLDFSGINVGIFQRVVKSWVVFN